MLFKKLLRDFVAFRFFSNSVFRTLLNIIFFNLFLFKFNYIVSLTVSMILSNFISYLINIYYVFYTQLTFYNIMVQVLLSIIYFLLMFISIYIFSNYFSFNPRIAYLIGVFILFPLSFFGKHTRKMQQNSK